jgi:hypothetical protein
LTETRSLLINRIGSLPPAGGFVGVGFLVGVLVAVAVSVAVGVRLGDGEAVIEGVMDGVIEAVMLEVTVGVIVLSDGIVGSGEERVSA